jgi:hypothetical protein
LSGPPKDPWGRPYQYLKIVGFPTAPVDPSNPGKPATTGKPSNTVAPENPDAIGGARKNMMDVPVNQDYDLYSRERMEKPIFLLRPLFLGTMLCVPTKDGMLALFQNYKREIYENKV